MTQYARGRRKEWDVVRSYRARKWYAQRSAGSRGLWDVVAVKPGHPVRLIQVKYTANPWRASGSGWQDANTDALLALARRDDPFDVEVRVYHKGLKGPSVWTVTECGLGRVGWTWEYQGA